MAQIVAVSREFEARLSHAATGKLSTQQKMGTSIELGKDKATKGEGWALPFISCAQDTGYSGTLSPTAPTAIRLWETYTFFTCLSLSLTDTSSLKYCLKEPLSHNQPTSHCRMHT